MIREALRKSLNALLDSASSQSVEDREAVEAACATFEMPELRDLEAYPDTVKASEFIQLLRGLSSGERSFSFPDGSPAMALALAECGCRQFKIRPDALLAIGDEAVPSGFFIAEN